MITEFKIFESLNEGEPQIGDYVLCNDRYGYANYFATHIGRKVKAPFGYGGGNKKYGLVYIQYDDIPDEIYQKYQYTTMKTRDINCFKLENIKYWSKNREDLEDILTANKYNL